MNHQPYKMSFTSRGLLRPESLTIADLYLELQDWAAVKAKVLKENILQLRTVSSQDRMSGEIIARLKTLDDSELRLLISATVSDADQCCLLWLALCRHYQFIADFALDVLRDHVAAMNFSVHYDDFDLFYAKKAEWHPELNRITEDTRSKLRRTLFKMMRDAELIDKSNQIRSIMLSPVVKSQISANNPDELQLIPGLIQ